MIDWGHVSALHTEVGENEFQEVVALFLEEVNQQISALRDKPDLNRLEERLHALKGSASNLGFTEFSSLCHKGEALSSKGKAIEVDITGIIQNFERSSDIFTSGLAKNLPPGSVLPLARFD